MERYLGTKVRVTPQESTVATVGMLKSGEMILAEEAHSTLGNGLEGASVCAVENMGPQRLAFVWVFFNTPYGVVVRGDSGLETMEDLNGKKMAFYNASAGWVATADVIFNSVENAQKVIVGDYNGVARAVAEGRADFTYLCPTSSVTYEIEENPAGLHWIPMWPGDKAAWSNFFEQKPRVGAGPANKGVASAQGVHMVQVWFITITSLDADEEVIYQISKFFGENFDEYKDAHEQAKDMSLENQTSFIKNYCAFPVHPGTIRYLKEKGIWTADDDVWNQGWLDQLDKYREAFPKAVADAKAKDIKIAVDNQEWMDLWQSYWKPLGIFNRT